ncbi:MAG: ferrous iron transport protein B [Tepidanaerobacter sp.]|jgi:ferrous iron transport protein B|nr:ferrous iron transport protein B [Tepidanaerobacter sp.]
MRMSHITMAIAGNPNTGKTSLFNHLTGARQHVGNWPGVTVEKKEGQIRYKDKIIRVVDLPGTYSLGAYSEDEIIAREFILNNESDVVVNTVDATNLSRNLYLTVQMLEMDANILIALNMMDEAGRLGIEIDLNRLSTALGARVVPTVAAKGKGIKEIIAAIIENGIKPSKGKFRIDYGEDVERVIDNIVNMIQDDKKLSKYPPRWLAIKLLEEDEKLVRQIKATLKGKEILSYVQSCRQALENKIGENLDSYIIAKRYEFIHDVISQSVQRPQTGNDLLTDKIDRIVTHNILGIPIFAAIMWLVFTFTFIFSEPLVEIVETGFSTLSELLLAALTGIGASEIFISFVVDGIVSGLGSVLSIVPVLFLLFIAIAMLEDSGYMARIAYVMDKPMRMMGLSGKAFVPFLLGFGCNVPAVMATRTIENKRDRLITILANPFISCSARLPVYVLFTSVFFPKRQALVLGSLYLLGVFMAIISVKLFGKIVPEQDDSSFIIELPPYRLPTLKGVFLHMWENVRGFLNKVSNIILAAVVIIWLLSSLPFGVEYASDESMIGRMSSLIAPILKPAGFGTWQAAIALIFGVLAKEIVISTLGVVYKAGSFGLAAVLSEHFTPLSAYSFMVMTLLYAPCIATIGSIRSETKSLKWTAVSVIYGLIIAWTMSVLIYQIGLMLGFS